MGVTQGGAVEETTEAISQVVEQTDGDQPEASEKTETTQDEVTAIEEREEAKTVPYGRFKEVNDQVGALREQIAALTAKAQIADQLSEALSPKAAEPDMPPQVKAALDTLKQYGVTTKDEILAEVRREMDMTFEQREFAQKLLSEAESLEKRYDGSNGMPRFDRSEVGKWLDEKGFTQDQLRAGGITLEGAYRLMHGGAIEDARVKEKRSTAFSEKPGQPMSSNTDNRAAEIEEAKKSGDWTGYLMKRVPMPGKS